ncbi:MAG: hypothetical protein JSU06_00435 [Actinobacteria bacterium]|nr:hypothetical protein [Actinomycetota bacterium]
MTRRAPTAGGAGPRRGARSIAPGDSIAVPLLRDFLLACLRHDALSDVTMERLDLMARNARLDLVWLAEALPVLVGDLLAVAEAEDWEYVADALSRAYLDAAREDGAALDPQDLG